MNKLIHIPKGYMPTIDQLPRGLQWVAEQIEGYFPGQGVARTIELAQIFRGVRFYVASIDTLARRVRDDAIRAEYDGGTPVKDIALRFQLSQRQVEKILAKPAHLSQAQLEERQGRLF